MTQQRDPKLFKNTLRSGRPLIGTFVKTRDHAMLEVLARANLDVVVLDCEHAPFERTTLDPCLLATRAGGLPSLVRIPAARPEYILAALDMGATGVVVPHVRTPEEAVAVVKACHYGPGGRGYAGSPRAADYTKKPMARHLAESAAETTVVAQIEDIEAVEAVDEIAAVEGVDCLFIGRVDLTVAYGAETVNDPRVDAAIERICAAGRKHDQRVGLFLANVDEAKKWLEAGVSFFLVGSDHGFVYGGASALVERFATAAK